MTSTVSFCRFWLVATSILLFVLGVVMIFNTTSAEMLEKHQQDYLYLSLFKQLLYAICGLFFACLLYLLGYQNLINMAPKLLFLGTVLLAFVLIPGIGVQANGAKRWIGLGGITIQPSEFVRQLIPLYIIYRIVQIDQDGKISKLDFLKIVSVIAIPIILVALEPNNGTVAIICVLVAATFFLLRVPYRFWAIPICLSLAVASVAAYNMPYVSARVKVYLNPEQDLLGRGHQPYQAKIAAGSGQLTGRGPGKSVQKLSYLPEAQNDYIAAIYAEEFGFVGVIGLVLLYMTMIFCGFTIAFLAKNRAAGCLGAALMFLIGLQAFLNLAVVSGVLPSTGLNLPFFSQGGSSLMANIGALGVLLSIDPL